ncbi:MAG: sporulation transcriptional regulator SpoIIID [Clostridia bacterium]|nr:sporulation transcriptional regulator SpoIIID [Clostridia bacterium]
MNKSIEERVLNEANHICKTHDTIRKTAKIYGMSKSTTHNDISVKLQYIDMNLYEKTRVILEKNFAEKHLRGGEATKRKYLNEQQQESTLF